MKIFVISDVYQGNGASEMLMNAARYWANDLGWHVDAVVKKDIPENAYQAIIGVGMRPILKANFSDNYDLAIINCIQNVGFVEVIYPKVPIILWAHEAETILNTTQCSDKDWASFFSKISMTVFQTEWQKKLYGHLIPNLDMVQILPNGIPPMNAIHSCKKESRFKIAMVGKITHAKNQSSLIKSVLRLADRYPLICEIIGDYSLLADTVNEMGALITAPSDNIVFTGYLNRDEALTKVASSDLFCFPSLSESFGLAPLEAALLGVPVILADLPVYRYIGWKHGINCMMFDPNVPEALDLSIERLVNNPDERERLALEGKKLASQFDNTVFLNKLSLILSKFH